MREPADLDPVASVAQRLAVLLEGGVAPARSWRYLADQPSGPTSRLLASVAAAAARGRPVCDAIVDAIDEGGLGQASEWRGLAAAWQVATDAGAPLAPTLQSFSISLRSLAQVQRELQSALAGPRATARLVLGLPIVGLLFGVALGFDTVTVLVTTAPGLGCLGVGLSLMAIARFWSSRLVASAAPRLVTPGLALDLVAIAVSGGISIPRALALVDAARTRCGLPDDGSRAALDEVIELSRTAGVPAAGLLRSEADEARRMARSAGDRRAATLAVSLMVPLGVCVLPAFLLLGVAPLLISVVSSTIGCCDSP
jgi:tight adherence protein B